MTVMVEETSVTLRVEHLTMAYGSNVVMRDVNFSVRRGEIFSSSEAAGAARARFCDTCWGSRTRLPDKSTMATGASRRPRSRSASECSGAWECSTRAAHFSAR